MANKIKLDVYSQAGEKVSTVEVSSYVFGQKENVQVMHDAVVVRARAGSSRSPIWVGGGTVFGPTGVQNHTIKQNRKEHNLALRCAYSAKVKDLIVVDEFKFSEKKTKNVVKMLKDLKADGKVLIVLSEENDNLVYSASNIATACVTPVNNVSVYDLMYFNKVVMDKATLKVVENSLEEAK